MTEPTLIPFDDWQGSPSEQVAKLRAELAAEQQAHAETRKRLEGERDGLWDALKRSEYRYRQWNPSQEVQAQIHELESTLAATARTVAEVTADRDELRVECTRLRAELLAYVESNNAVPVENG